MQTMNLTEACMCDIHDSTLAHKNWTINCENLSTAERLPHWIRQRSASDFHN